MIEFAAVVEWAQENPPEAVVIAVAVATLLAAAVLAIVG